MASSKPEFHVPGAYHFDTPSWPASTLGAGIFLPPTSTSASSSVLNLDKSSASFSSDVSNQNVADSATAANSKRKRPAQDSRESTPLAGWSNMSAEPTVDAGEGLYPRTAVSAARGATNRYTFAGQIEAVGTSDTGAIASSFYSDVGYRRALGPDLFDDTGDVQKHTHADSSHVYGPPALEQWSVLQALGNVVGKVWEFCRGSAFRGFHAGGGVGYDWDTGRPSKDTGTNSQDTLMGDVQAAADVGKNASLPGDYSHLDLTSSLDGGSEKAIHTAETRRAGKRRQVGLAGEELGRNWVMVDTDQGRERRQRSTVSVGSAIRRTPLAMGRIPVRRTSFSKRIVTDGGPRRISTPVSRLGATPVQSRITGSHVSHTGSPHLSPHDPTSFAPSRSPVPVPYLSFDHDVLGQQPSRIPLPKLGGIRADNPFARAASPGLGGKSKRRQSITPLLGSPTSGSLDSESKHRRNQSSSVAASFSRKSLGISSLEGSFDASPRLNNEFKALAARRRAADINADAKMEAFNMRLQAMIRQGKEALGTAFEIEGDGEHEGWIDDD